MGPVLWPPYWLPIWAPLLGPLAPLFGPPYWDLVTFIGSLLGSPYWDLLVPYWLPIWAIPWFCIGAFGPGPMVPLGPQFGHGPLASLSAPYLGFGSGHGPAHLAFHGRI